MQDTNFTRRTSTHNRRAFLKSAGLAAVAFQIVPRHVLGQGLTPPSEKLNIAGIGIGGQGGGVLQDMKTENIVALCDVDFSKAGGTFQAFPKAEPFKDYRVMLEKRKDIEAVMVATPDHMHAPISLAALRAGKHVYVEKPMAHTIEEARVMAKVARETGLVTQMGNNGHAGEGLRLTREWIKACKDKRPEDAKAGFAYSGPFTEALLVGNLATRLQKRIEWDAARMKASNAPEAETLIRKKYRTGFGI